MSNNITFLELIVDNEHHIVFWRDIFTNLSKNIDTIKNIIYLDSIIFNNLNNDTTINENNISKIISSDYFSKLKSLYFNGCDKLTDLGLLNFLSNKNIINNLQVLHINSNKNIRQLISNDGIKPISSLINLNTLLLSNLTIINDAGLLIISEINNLKHLKLYDCENITDIGLHNLCIKLSIKLQSLSIHMCNKITDDGLKSISDNLISLVLLDIGHHYNFSNRGLKYIANGELLNLTNLYLSYSCRFNNDGIIIINDSIKLIKLNSLKICYCDNINLKLLSLSLNIKSLEFKGYKCLNECFTHELLFYQVRNLQALYLNQCDNINVEILYNIATNLISLNILDITGSNITDQDIDYLSKNKNNIFPQLKSINLSKCYQITDEGLKYLTNIDGILKNLEELYLNKCYKITDIGLNYIKLLKNLKLLDISWCNQITDTSMNIISLYLNKLKSLNIAWCKNITNINYIFNIKTLVILNITGCNNNYKILLDKNILCNNNLTIIL